MSDMRRGGSTLRDSHTGERTLAQKLALLIGLTFLLAGIAGFIPGITGDYDQLRGAGTESDAELLGLFRVSVLHNIVHMLFGIGILAAARDSWSKLYLIGGGIAYILVALYGFVIDEQSDANFLPINDADNLLHVGFALTLLAAWLVALGAERRGAHR